MFMRAWMHVYTKFEGQFVVFVVSVIVGLTFACVYIESWRWGAFLRSPQESQQGRIEK